jgi:choice-of-anchor B domain-containing protein
MAVGLLLTLFAGQAAAHSSPPLYVTEGGGDEGDCSDRDNPCASIGYALEIAEKNAHILVAPGRYSIDDPADLIYMLSGLIIVTGSYSFDGSAAEGQSILTGVPVEYREILRGLGFHVIADTKGIDIEKATTARAMMEYLEQAQLSAGAADCIGGSASGFECNNIDLLSQTARPNFSSSPSLLSDIWGFVDLNTHREYVIVGVSNGTAVFDVTDPEDPREVGFVGGKTATWRDIKVYQRYDVIAGRWHAYAYVTTDGSSDGLFVIDLGGLPHSIRRLPYASDFTNAHNLYLTDTDYSTGIRTTLAEPQLIIAGSGIDRGQFRTYSLADPKAPEFVHRVKTAGYMHDATSLLITDARRAECGSDAACNMLVDFNERNVELWNITAPNSPRLLKRVAKYPETGYVHSGWWSEDGRYLFVHDERDERKSVPTTTVRVLSLASLANPEYVGSWVGSVRSVDHNGYVRGNRYYISNYTRGLTILDITRPVTPVEVGFFDTYPPNNSTAFAGAWGVYPFLHSDTIAVSDVSGGLYLLRDNTRSVAQGSIEFTASSFSGQEGQPATLHIARKGLASGPVSVGYEIVAATASNGDYHSVGGRLNWSSNDLSEKTVSVDLLSDGISEWKEQLLVRLVDPKGGATLGARDTASVYIADAGSPSQISMLTNKIYAPERGFGKAVLVLQRGGNATGSASVDYSVTSRTATGGVDFQGAMFGTVRWANGDADPKSIEFELIDDGIEEPAEFFRISLSNPQGALVAGPENAFVIVADGFGADTAPVR